MDINDVTMTIAVPAGRHIISIETILFDCVSIRLCSSIAEISSINRIIEDSPSDTFDFNFNQIISIYSGIVPVPAFSVECDFIIMAFTIP